MRFRSPSPTMSEDFTSSPGIFPWRWDRKCAPPTFKLGLPSTLISYNNGVLQKRCQEFKNAALALLFEQKKIWKETELQKNFKNHEVTLIIKFLCSSISQAKIHWQVIGALSDFSGVVWTGSIRCVFRAETYVFKFLQHNVVGAYLRKEYRLLDRFRVSAINTVRDLSTSLKLNLILLLCSWFHTSISVSMQECTWIKWIKMANFKLGNGMWNVNWSTWNERATKKLLLYIIVPFCGL